MRKQTQFLYEKDAYENGITITIRVDFIEREEGKTMEVLQASASTRWGNAIDYGSVTEQTTIDDLLKDLEYLEEVE